MKTVFLIALALMFCASCREASKEPRIATPNTNASNRSGEGINMQIKLWSTVFQDNGSIPPKYTCDDMNVSPPLEWSAIPPDTKSIALIVDDPDAPAKTWVHWVVYDLPATTTQLPENVRQGETTLAGGKQGKNDFGKLGYGGPCPPSGTHRYFFKIYAVDIQTGLPSGATKEELLRTLQGHIVKQGELMGKYQRGR